MTIHLPRYILIFDKTNFRISLQKGAIVRTVILTFDDAVISQYENVAPLLKERGFGATFFICRFNDEWRKKNEEICRPILAVLRQVAEEVHGIYIDADDLLSNNEKIGNGDDIHFCRESLHILGRRYFEAYLKVTNGVI